MQHIQTAFQDLELIRQKNPVVHNITNLVVMNTSANVLLALGASPIMAHAESELEEITQISNALVINIGTLDNFWIQAMKKAQQAAKQRGIPIILDPVGAGASRLRTETAKQLLQNGITIVRGNASEIIALAGSENKTKGVDSQHKSDQAIAAAEQLSKEYNCVVVISGQTDVIVAKTRHLLVSYGTPLFTKVTGMGCASTAVIGAFCSVNNNYLQAAQHAMSIFSLAGMLAAEEAKGPASFYTNLIDVLYSMKITDVLGIVNV